MVDEELKNDVVKEARELLSKVTPWPWDTKRGDHCWHVGSLDGTFETGCIMFAGGKGTSEGNAKFIARSPELLSALCDEVEELRRRNSTQEESITHLQSQQRVMKEAMESLISAAEFSASTPGLVRGRDQLKNAIESARSAITPKAIK